MTMPEIKCLFNTWSKTPEGEIKIFDVKPGNNSKKCKRCGNECYLLTWTGSRGESMAAFISLNRPDGCNGETYA